MKNSFLIGEISELLKIPKSTLRYWESEGLIDLQRDNQNNYRKYNTSTIYTISDLAHYRCLQMSLQDLKNLPNLSPHELADTLISLDNNLNNKLKELYTAKDYIEKKIHHIGDYKNLCENQYQKETPDYSHIYLFSIDDTEAWSLYIKDQYQSVLLFNPEKDYIETGLVVPTSEQHPKIWSKEKNSTYVSFILKVNYSNPSADDFTPHIEMLKEEGYKVKSIVARYLFSAYDNQYFDYYKAFAEVYS